MPYKMIVLYFSFISNWLLTNAEDHDYEYISDDNATVDRYAV